MLTKFIDKTHTTLPRTGKLQFLSLLATCIFALTMCPTRADAQIVGDMEATIPFQFHAGNAKLPPGKYVIHVLDDSDLTIMEISSADGSTSALFEVRAAQSSSSPAKSELIFNKYGDHYFLAQLFDEGDPSGSTVIESRYEKRISRAAAETQQHVPAHHKGRVGS
jgi:hypothetical protein